MAVDGRRGKGDVQEVGTDEHQGAFLEFLLNRAEDGRDAEVKRSYQQAPQTEAERQHGKGRRPLMRPATNRQQQPISPQDVKLDLSRTVPMQTPL